MANDNKKTKNNAPCEGNQEARQLTEEDLEQVTGGGTPIGLPIVADDFLKDKNISVIVTDIKY